MCFRARVLRIESVFRCFFTINIINFLYFFSFLIPFLFLFFFYFPPSFGLLLFFFKKKTNAHCSETAIGGDTWLIQICDDMKRNEREKKGWKGKWEKYLKKPKQQKNWKKEKMRQYCHYYCYYYYCYRRFGYMCRALLQWVVRLSIPFFPFPFWLFPPPLHLFL